MENGAIIGFSKDKNILRNCASGGAASCISREFIRAGGIVVSVGYSSDFKSTEFFVAETEHDIEKFAGSKYVYSRKRIQHDYGYEPLVMVLESLYKSNRKILFIGLPCECNMINNYFEHRFENLSNLFLIDLICQGTMPESAHAQYIEKLEKKYKSKITYLNVKSTIEDWRKPRFIANFQNGKVYNKNLYFTDYGLFFYMFSRKACYYCRCKGSYRVSDVTLGDYWAENYEGNGINRLGTSVLIQHSDKGAELLNMLRTADFYLEALDEEQALKGNPMYYKCRMKKKGWENIETEVSNHDISYVLKKNIGYLKYYLLKIKNSKII